MLSGINEKKGLTMTELLVAASLVGIVMVGAVSVDYAVRSSRQSASKLSSLSMKVAVTMLRITQDAMLVQGNGDWIGCDNDYGTNQEAYDRAGIWCDDGGSSRAICFRYETASPPTPTDYTDDRWVCYEHGGSNDINRCDDRTSPTDSCPGSPPEDMEDMLQLTQSDFFEVVEDANGQIDYIEVYLVSRYDKNYSANAISNPQYKLKTRVSPPGLSR